MPVRFLPEFQDFSVFTDSGGSPGLTPLAKSIVPIAPSATRISLFLFF